MNSKKSPHRKINQKRVLPSTALGTRIKETVQPVQKQEFWDALEADGDVVLDDQPHHSDEWNLDRIGPNDLSVSQASGCSSPGKSDLKREPLLDEEERDRLDEYNRLVHAQKTAWRQECSEQQKMYTMAARKPFRSLRRMPEPGLQRITVKVEGEYEEEDPPTNVH